MTNLVKKVQNTIFQHELFGRGDKIILAVSGGPDSCAMLDVFSKLQKKYSLELCIAHVNYGLRGKDSDQDEKLVRELGERYGIEVEVLRLVETQNFASLRERKKLSENYLRDIRYDFFEKLRSKKKFNAIAVAHNADDQVETFFLHLIRGAGLQGLSAMQFKNNRLIRPLLATTRKEILDYLKKNILPYRIDKTNLQNEYLRNKIRNRLLPYLEKNFNPNVRETIFDSTMAISEDADFLKKETEKSYQKNLALDARKLSKLHPAILRRILRKKIEEIKGDLKNISAAHIEEILKILKSTKNKTQVVVFEGLKITRKGDKLEISRKI